MKKLILILILVCPFLMQAQTTTETVNRYYVSHSVSDTLDVVEPIDSIVYDTTFTYTLVITDVSENSRDTTITKKSGMTDVEIQAHLYSKINQDLNDVARFRWQAVELLRRRNVYLSALNAVGLNNYFADTRTRVRQSLNGNWIIRSNGVTYNCTVSNNNGALRTNGNDTSGEAINTVIARLVPRSDLFISLNFEDPSYGTDTEIFTSNWSVYTNDDLSVRLKYNK